jgi:glutamate carboxypeptidase
MKTSLSENTKDDMNSAIANYLKDREPEMLTFLKNLVLTQSGTRHKAGVDRVGRLIAQTLSPLGLKVAFLPQEKFGDILSVATPTVKDGRNVLLVGHMDTVFPADTAFNWCREEGEEVRGPGVIDMKGGLVVIVYALKALGQVGEVTRLPIQCIFNPDEEVGSPVSGPLISAEAKRSAMAFVMECGGLNGGVVTGRKGRWGFKLEFRGKGGHAAFAKEDKASAIMEMAYKILRLEGLNGFVEGLTVNVGQIQGGIGPNTVAEEAAAWVDIRFMSAEGENAFVAKLDEIIDRPFVAGTTVKVESISRRPPMAQTAGNRALFEVVAKQGEALGLSVMEEYRYGVSDANRIAAENTPVLDGLGPIGDQDHSDREYMVKSSLVERCQLLALSLLEAWRSHEEGTLFR